MSKKHAPFWMNELSKLSVNSNNVNSTNHKNEVVKTSKEDLEKLTAHTDTHTFGKLLDLDELAPPEEASVTTSSTKEDSPKIEKSSLDKTSKGFKFEFPVKPFDSSSIERKSKKEAPNTSNITTGNGLKSNRRAPYDTELITCCLNDLLLGLESPVIKAAVSKMKEEGKEATEETTKQSLPVEDQKPVGKKMYSVNAKEFVPFTIKKSTRTYSTKAKEFVPFSK